MDMKFLSDQITYMYTWPVTSYMGLSLPHAYNALFI